MAPKLQLEKSAWSWAQKIPPDSITTNHIETAYRIRLKPCEINACKKNCSGNPNCLNGLGERKWIKDGSDVPFADNSIDPTTLQRDLALFVGLDNLGATCYINTFLQVWFHNRAFRTAVLQWVDPSDEEDVTELEKASLDSLVMTSACAQLQLVFALLAFSNRRSFAPESFIRTLEIDITDQQDAQEFSKLFMALLEKDSAMRTIIQQQYMGVYEYITCCQGCGSEAASESTFYELVLNIKGHKELSGCLTEFLQDEMLTADNQYHCQRCARKQDAIHRIRLKTLPPVLNFQLVRFIFESGRKKKLNSYITFPETLDMSAYVPQSAGADMIYDLFAVLIHLGPSASSGHYVALIKNPVTGDTYRFNDTEVTKITDKKFNIASEEECDGMKTKEKRPRTLKGCNTSRSAYMLVYRLRSLNTDVSFPEVTLDMLPTRVRRYVQLDNEELDKEIKRKLAEKEKNLNSCCERQNEIQELYSLMFSLQDESRCDSCEWISCEWLTKWLSCSDSTQVPPIDNSKLLCRHQRLDPESVAEAKLVSCDAAENLFSRYSGNPRLPCHESLCRECVVARCFVEFNKTRLAESDRDIKALLKSNNDMQSSVEGCFWVAKTSLRSWCRLAINALQNTAVKQGITFMQEECCADSSEGSNGDAFDTSDAFSASDSSGCCADREDRILFNSDILCPQHGDLCINAKTRILVSADVWRCLTEPFAREEYIEIVGNHPECQLCKDESEEEQKKIDWRKKRAAAQKVDLLDLYHSRNRPSRNSSRLYIVSSVFVNDWKKFVREPTKQMPVLAVCNTTLLCSHNKFCCPLPSPDENDDECASLTAISVREDEWAAITKHFAVDIEIKQDLETDADGREKIVWTPALCEMCYSQCLQEAYMSRFTYENAALYVCKVNEIDRTIVHDSNNENRVPADSACSMSPSLVTDESEDILDVDCTVQSDNKRKQCASPDIGTEFKIRKVEAATPSGQQLRRSSRRHDKNSGKEFKVSSSQTLHDFKMQVARVYEVMKTDQHLFFDGVELRDDNATLQQLQVPQGSVIYLKIDEPASEQSPTTDADVPVSGHQTVEKGFKGTLLSV